MEQTSLISPDYRQKSVLVFHKNLHNQRPTTPKTVGFAVCNRTNRPGTND